MIDKTLRLGLAMMLGAIAAATCGCAPSAAPSPGVTLAYVAWDSCVAATNVVKAALEQRGFEVRTQAYTGASMYMALAQGDADATVCAWLPSTHAVYYARTHARLANLGPNLSGARIGLVVPQYVTIDAIDELATHAGQFGRRIVGIDPDAGEMGITRKAIRTYRLPLALVEGSAASMAAALESAIERGEWIVVTGWTPHWMWTRWKLKYLADPKGSFGGAEDIDTLARQGLQQDSPGAFALLDGFRWTPAQMQQVMMADRQPHADAEANARAWVRAHPGLVAAWAADGADTSR